MDQCARPISIPPEFMEYSEKTNLFDFFNNLMTSLIVTKPLNPVEFLINQLDQLQSLSPRIILFGPPASGKSSIATKLKEEFKLVVITINSLLEDANFATRDKIYEYITSDMPVPLELIAKMISDRTSQFDCRKHGWVIDGVIDNKELFQDVQSLGVFPSHVIHLTAQDDMSLMMRADNWRVDIETGEIYNLLYNPPPTGMTSLVKPPRCRTEEMMRNLLRYHREKTRFEEAHKNIKRINSNQPLTDLIGEVCFYVRWHKVGCCPRVPKIILIGPPSCGKSKIAEKLSNRYDFAKISVKKLIKQEIECKTTLGDLLAEYTENGDKIPAAIKMKCLTERLKKQDCLVKGWVITDFPENIIQAQLLSDSNIFPDKVFFIKVNEEKAGELKIAKRTDPVTGDCYNLERNPPKCGFVAERMLQNPKNMECEVLGEVERLRENVGDLEKYYLEKNVGVCVNGEQDILSVYENIEAHLLYFKK